MASRLEAARARSMKRNYPTWAAIEDYRLHAPTDLERALAVVSEVRDAKWAIERLRRDMPASNPLSMALHRIEKALAWWEEEADAE